MILEDFFDVSREEIETLKAKEKRFMPSTNRIHYLEERLKRFRNSGWKLITYLAHNNPSMLLHHLKMYSDYEGSEAKAEVIKDLKQYYVLRELLSEYQGKSTKKR